jgi:membrane-associated phospholipid phosphatase
VRDRRADLFADADVDRLNVFVPAVMSAGLLFSLVTVARDALHRLRGNGGHRAALHARASAIHVLTGAPPRAGLADGLRPRRFYLVVAATALALAGYVLVGSLGNYIRPGGYVAEAAWLLALSLVAAGVVAAVGVVSVAAFARWPEPPAWSQPLLTRTPLTQAPAAEDAAPGPGWAVSALIVAVTGAMAILTLAVTLSKSVVERLDEGIIRLVDGWPGLGGFVLLDPVGHADVALVLAVVVGVATVRCVPLATTYLVSVGAGIVTANVLRDAVGRARPAGTDLSGLRDSFPSGHVVQAVLLAGFVPLALLVLTRRRRLARAVAVALGVGAAGSALHRIQDGVHWPSDVAGGALLGVALVAVGHWVVQHTRWHARCRGCPWQEALPASIPPQRGIVPISAALHRRLRIGAALWMAAAVLGFGWLAWTSGIPRNPEGDLLGSQIEGPAQLGLLAILAVGALIGWRWQAPAAVVIAVAGAALGTLAAVEYRPFVAAAVAVVFLVPAVGYWLAWQHDDSWGTVGVVGVLTLSLLGGGWAAATRIHDNFFGPSHPQSALEAEPVDLVETVWTGAVTSSEATVVARVAPGHQRARVVLRPVAGPAAGAVASASVDVGAGRFARMVVGGLEPAREYRYVVEVDGRRDRSRGDGTVRTFAAGATDLTVAVGSCARTGSNGLVFEAIARKRPDLYVISGDMHYGNLYETDVAMHQDVLTRALTAPAQAALYARVPVAYMWDDHDFGPNDADAASPSRAAAAAAYRRVVPHYGLPDDVGVYQAFTVGRVRFVMSDTRSQRTATSMLGARQLAWLEHELRTSSRTHALVVWVNPDPWIGAARAGADSWAGYAAERRHIGDVIAGEGIDNLVMLSGDAHMVAIDDGSNSDYSTTGGGGFPILHAAALDRPGNTKGGPYSEGERPGAGQFGTLRIDDDGGSTVGVELAGWNWRGERLLSHAFTVDATPAR